jgi:hypothetical protein
MSATVTVTGVAGPAKTVSAQVFSGVGSFTIDCVNNVISLNISGAITDIAITAATTITATKSGSTYTLVIS